MKYRINTPDDIKSIVNIHYNIRKTYSVGIFAQLDKSFLYQYYKILLKDKNEIIVCAENESGEILGFCSATLNVEAQFAKLRRHKLILGLSALKSIICNPLILKSLFSRYRSTKSEGKEKFVSTKGARLEYWAWDANNKDSLSSIEMHEQLLMELKSRGANEVFFEVDTLNKKIFLFHKSNGAEVLERIVLPDGRERALMKYNLLNRNPKV